MAIIVRFAAESSDQLARSIFAFLFAMSREIFRYLFAHGHMQNMWEISGLSAGLSRHSGFIATWPGSGGIHGSTQ